MRRPTAWAAAFLGAALGQALAGQAAEVDIKRLAPTDAHMVVYARHNPERDYQTQYLADAWRTFREEKIGERVWKIISSRAPQDKLSQVQDAWSQIEAAAQPINWQAVSQAQEFLMVSVMENAVGHTLVVLRLPEADAAAFRQGTGNLFGLFEKWSDGKVTLETAESGDATLALLTMPDDRIPFRPAAASSGELVLLSTNRALLERCLAQMKASDAASKFDDPRLAEALEALPEAEDMVSFFDMRQMMVGMRSIGDMIRANPKGNEEAAARATEMMNLMIDQMNFLDFEVSVGYTEAGQNRTASFTRLTPSREDSILGRAISQGQPFEDWQKWVPAEATAYSLGTGINVHELYAGIMALVEERVPEAADTLQQWRQVQERVGVDLGRDVLQPFTGEYVSITLPGGQSVTALRCTEPEKVRELLGRAMQGIKNIPAAAMYGLELVDVDDSALEGFQELKSSMLSAVPARPVIGFRDGWMMFASTPEAAKTVLAVRTGEAKSIAEAESLQRFNLDVDGPVRSVSYSDIGAGIRQFADGMTQVAMMAPMLAAPALAEAPPEVKQVVNEALALLPSIAKVIRKFDFYEQRLTIVRPGADDDVYRSDAVTLIRQPSP